MIRTFLSTLVIGATLFASSGSVTPPGSSLSQTSAIPSAIQRLDPAANALIPADAVLEKVAGGFTWTEGPLWLPSGDLLFAEIISNSIRRWSPAAGTSTVLQPSGYRAAAPFGGREPGSNGMALDARGRLTVAGHGGRNVWRLEGSAAEDSAFINPATILADSYKGKLLNSPNDLVYRSDGSLYFSDPPYGLPTQRDDDPGKQLQVNGVYRIPGAVKQAAGAPPARDQLQLVVSDLPRPNGLAFSPDERYLYVSNSEPEMLWMRYRVASDGSLKDAKVFFDAGQYAHHGAPDGMKVDKRGNVYSAGPGGVWIFSPAGVHLATIAVPEPVGNVAWGNSDRRTLYIAASTSIYRIALLEPAATPLHASRPAR